MNSSVPRERLNVVSARVPSHFKRSLLQFIVSNVYLMFIFQFIVYGSGSRLCFLAHYVFSSVKLKIFSFNIYQAVIWLLYSGFRSSGMWHCVTGWMVSAVLKEFFMVHLTLQNEGVHYSNHKGQITQRRGIISQKCSLYCYGNLKACIHYIFNSSYAGSRMGRARTTSTCAVRTPIGRLNRSHRNHNRRLVAAIVTQRAWASA
jgi:hypothetical protein